MILNHDVTPGQFVSVAHYGAWMRGEPLRANGARTKIKPRWRAMILKHARYRCEQCDSTSDIQVEHIVPVAFGGSNEPCNLTALCGTHNRERWSPAFRELLAMADAA